MKAIWSVVGVAGLVVGFVGVRVAGAQTYTITDLQPGSGFDDAFAYGISQNGKITGAGSVTGTGELHAFIWDNGVMQDLGTLGFGGATGEAINNSGQVAATEYGVGWHAVLYSAGHVTSIAGGETALNSEGFAINNLGHVVGRIQGDDGGFQPFKYFGSFSTLAMSRALGINDLDQIAGSTPYDWVYGGYGHEVEHACVMSGSTVVELGDLGGGLRTNSAAYSINGAGQVTGYSTLADGSIHAFLYRPSAGGGGVLSDLGTIGSYYTYGVSINAAEVVAGNIQTYVGGQIGVFLYDADGMHNLADLLGAEGAAWDGLTVTGMNDAGWIVGWGNIGGATHGFVARPGGGCGSADFNGDGDVGTDADIEAFFACLGGDCCATCDPHGADFNGDGDVGTDADIEAFFRVLGGGTC